MAGKFCSMSSISVSLLIIICCASVLSPTSSARLVLPGPGCPRCICCGPPIYIPLEEARPVPDIITVDPNVRRPIDPVVVGPVDPDLPTVTPILPPITGTPDAPPIRTPPPPPPPPRPPRVIVWPPVYCCRCCRYPWFEPFDPLPASQPDQIAAPDSP